MDNELEAVKRDYMVFTTIEQQLKDGVQTMDEELLRPAVYSVLKVIEQHKADLFAKYNL